MTRRRPPLPWLEPGEPFPDPVQAWGPDSPAPGLLAAGGTLDTQTLLRAYRSGIFPWFSVLRVEMSASLYRFSRPTDFSRPAR